MRSRSCTTPPGAGPHPLPPPPSLQSALSPPPPIPSAGVGGGSPPPGREIRRRFVAAPLPVFVARDFLPDPHGRRRLPRVISSPSCIAPVGIHHPTHCTSGHGPPSTAPVGIDVAAPDVARVRMGRVRGGGQCPGVVASLVRAVWESPVVAETVSPGAACPVTSGSPADAGAASSGGVIPAAKWWLSSVGPVSSAAPLAAARVALG